MEFSDDPFDAAVATCVFCSVPDPVQGFREAKRVVKLGGRVFLMEHMRHTNPIIGAVMDTLTPLMRWMGPDTPLLRWVQSSTGAHLTMFAQPDWKSSMSRAWGWVASSN